MVAGRPPDPQQALQRALLHRGVAVRFDPEADNALRLESDISGATFARIDVQGIPNLVHECVHAIFQEARGEAPSDDHGFDYGRIPVDLDAPEGRQCFFEELSACVLSCAWIDAEKRSAWFIEQISIQPVFYGSDVDVLAFAHRSARAIAQDLERWQETLRFAAEGLSGWVEEHGATAPPPVPWRPLLRAWWQTLGERASQDGSSFCHYDLGLPASKV